MSIAKAFLLTFLYYFLLEVTSLWSLLESIWDIHFLKVNMHLINGVLMLIIVSFYLYRTNNLKLNLKFSTWFIIVAIAAGIAFRYIQYPLDLFYCAVTNAPRMVDIRFDMITSMNSMYFAMIFIVPVTEELVFRNYIQRKLNNRLGFWVAIAVASVCFALIHINVYQLYHGKISIAFHSPFIVLFGGVVSGMLLYRSSSIIPSILFHMTWNLMVFLN